MRLSLRGKLTAAFLAVTILPLVVCVGLLSLAVDREFRGDLRRKLDEATGGISSQLDQVEAELRKGLDRVAENDELKYLDQDLKWDAFYGDQAREKELVDKASELMTDPQLDVLEILDAGRDGHVIAMGHRKGIEAADDEAVRAVLDEESQAMWRVAKVGEEAIPVWTVQVAMSAGERVVLVGGRAVDGPFLRDLADGLGGRPDIVLRHPSAGVLASTLPSEHEVPAPDTQKFEVAAASRALGDGSDGQLSVEVYLSRDELDRTLRSLFLLAGLLAASGLLLSLFLAIVLSRAIVRPVQALVEGTEAIAAGRLEHRIEVTTYDELGELVGGFNQMAGDLADSQRRLVQAERVAAWKDIARQIAHEVKNPLFPIQTSVETLRRAWERKHPRFDELFDDGTRTILEQVERLVTIVSEFSRFARLPAPRLVDTDLVAMVRDAAALFASGVEEGELPPAFDLALDEGLPAVPLDATLFGQVLNNLIKNAVEACADSKGKGEVRLSLSRDEKQVRLVVEDDGQGVPEERRKEIFDPYVTHKEGGTGLGLAVAHRVVTEHGGSIRVEDGELGGARFVVELPLRFGGES